MIEASALTHKQQNQDQHAGAALASQHQSSQGWLTPDPSNIPALPVWKEPQVGPRCCGDWEPQHLLDDLPWVK